MTYRRITTDDVTLDAMADAIDAARYQHPTHPRERSRPWSEADPSDQEYARRLARAALSAIARASAPAGAGERPYVVAGSKELGDRLDALLDRWLTEDDRYEKSVTRTTVETLLWDNKLTFIRLLQGQIATDAAPPAILADEGTKS